MASILGPFLHMENRYQIQLDPEIARILHSNSISLIFSTYQAGKLMILGSSDGINLHQIPISSKKPMGIALEGTKMAIATLDEINFYSNNEKISSTLKLNENQFDTVYVQRSSYNTSSLDIHDIHFGDGVLWGVNTLFSCLCTFDINYNFRPKWKPPFIDTLLPEDRCHLNGMTMKDGLPKYVTALSKTNTKEGWRENIKRTGILMEVPSGDIILDNLSMPHSPRLIDDQLYVLESGNGNLLKVDPEKKTSEVIFNFNRFIRGMSHYGDLLFIGTSKIRETSKSFNVLDVKDSSNYSGIIIFDLKKQAIIGEINYENTVEEIYDVQVIEGFNKPVILTQTDERHKEIITFPGNVFWRKPKQ